MVSGIAPAAGPAAAPTVIVAASGVALTEIAGSAAAFTNGGYTDAGSVGVAASDLGVYHTAALGSKFAACCLTIS